MTYIAGLTAALIAAGIETSGCNSAGIVWDVSGNEIQNRADVRTVIDGYDPAPEQIEDAVQAHLDTTAQSRGYTSMERLCGWAQSTNLTWQAEALTAIEWRDLCFESTYEIINRGAPYPTPAEVVAQLPPIVWPVL